MRGERGDKNGGEGGEKGGNRSGERWGGSHVEGGRGGEERKVVRGEIGDKNGNEMGIRTGIKINKMGIEWG